MKWIFSALGFLFSGSIWGAFVGYGLGSLFESKKGKDNARQEYLSNGRTQGDFHISLLILFAEVMKSDGRILKSELNYVKQWLVQNFGENEAQKQVLLLRELLNQNTDIQNACERITTFLSYPNRLQLLHCLFQIALADGECSKTEINAIERISNYLRLSSADYKTILNMYFKDTDSAYAILQVDKSASEEEIKKAYKKLCIKYHPDKVAHLGEEIQKSANEKFQKINEAYEIIKKERNFK
ncbi:MAG: TerB family tellurite resistance protein [Bacteroidales bacterium]|nr:TerB family tellurite resistance protein [Bacteroidales bacterium]